MKEFATLHDFAAREDFNKNIAEIINTMVNQHALLKGLMFTECNQKTKHTTTITSQLPEVAFRLLNQGGSTGGGKTKQIDFTTGYIDHYASIDKKLADLNGNSAAWRLSEEKLIQMAISDKLATTAIYGDEKRNPAGFTGLGAYYYTKDAGEAGDYAKQIVDCGGTGDNLTSMYIVCHGLQTIHGIYSSGANVGAQTEFGAGVSYTDHGVQIVNDERNKPFSAYRSQYEAEMGLAIRNYKSVARLANIDIKSLTDEKMKDFIDCVIDMYIKVKNVVGARPVIYCNDDLLGYIYKAATRKANVSLAIRDFAGVEIPALFNIPIESESAIITGEEQVV